MRQSEPRYGRLCVLLLGLRVLLAFSDPLEATKRTALRPSVRSSLGLRVLLVSGTSQCPCCGSNGGELPMCKRPNVVDSGGRWGKEKVVNSSSP